MQASVQFTTQQVYFVIIKCWGRLHALRRIGPVQLAINHLHLRNYCKTFEPLERTRLQARVPQTHIVRDLELMFYFQELKKTFFVPKTCMFIVQNVLAEKCDISNKLC